MPELPEVETVKRAIEPVIKGKIISDVIIRDRRLRWAIPKNFEKNVAGNKIKTVERRGKYLLLNSNAGSLLIHLGMSGRLHLIDPTTNIKKHDHADFIFSKKLALRFHDPRRFGALIWTEKDPHQHKLLKHLGIEPFDQNFTANYLYERSRKKITSTKQFLMDGKIVVGVGNIYANEVLFLANIHPLRVASTLLISDCEKLVSAIQRVLSYAIELGGTTLKDFQSADGKPGYFQQDLKVYGRENENCFVCKQTLEAVRINNRATVFCAKCQK